PFGCSSLRAFSRPVKGSVGAVAFSQTLGQAIVEIVGDRTQIDADLSQVEASVGQLGDRLQQTGQQMQQVGKRMSLSLTAPLTAMAGVAVKTFTDFEQGMATVQAVSGATGAEFESLRAQAIELGATTRFAASEAASGMEFLARAGFETSDMLAAMPGLLDL